MSSLFMEIIIMKEKATLAVKLLPDFFIDLVILILMIPRKLITEFDKITVENGHYYLQQYNIAQLLGATVLFYTLHTAYEFIYTNYNNMKDLTDAKFLVVCAAPGFIWPLLNKIWDSMDLNYVKSAKDVLGDDKNE